MNLEETTKLHKHFDIPEDAEVDTTERAVYGAYKELADLIVANLPAGYQSHSALDCLLHSRDCALRSAGDLPA